MGRKKLACISDFRMCEVTKSRGNENNFAGDTIQKKWCHHLFCGSANFALGLTKSQP
jgi:hypothetical protein